MIRLLGLILMIGLTRDVRAETCTTVDLNSAANSPFRNMPVYDQDGSGTCFAHAGAQLIDYWRFKKGTSSSDRVNPIFAAWQTKYKYRGEKDTRSEFGYNVIRNLKKSGYCKNEKVKECLKSAKEKGGNLSDAELVHYLEVLYEKHDALMAKDPWSPKQNTINAIKEVEKDHWVGGTRCRKLSDHILSNYLTLSVSTSNIILDGAFKDCKPLHSLSSIPDPKVQSYGTYSTKKSKIDESLGGGQPVSIAMCSSMFNNPKNRPLNAKNKPSNWNTCGGHEVLVTARKQIGNTCHYLVRNSWGAMWKPQGVNCACYRKDGVYEPICSNVSKAREMVGCWYSSSDLLSNVYETTTFYPAK